MQRSNEEPVTKSESHSPCNVFKLSFYSLKPAYSKSALYNRYSPLEVSHVS